MTSRYITWQDERADSETLYSCERSKDLVLNILVTLDDWLGMSILPSVMKTDRQQAWALLPCYIHVGEIPVLIL